MHAAGSGRRDPRRDLGRRRVHVVKGIYGERAFLLYLGRQEVHPSGRLRLGFGRKGGL